MVAEAVPTESAKIDVASKLITAIREMIFLSDFIIIISFDSSLIQFNVELLSSFARKPKSFLTKSITVKEIEAVIFRKLTSLHYTLCTNRRQEFYATYLKISRFI